MTTHPRIRTYARRGRMTATQRDALDRLGERWIVPVCDGPLDLTEVFGGSAPVIIDIGCGMGGTTVEQAAAQLDTNVLAVDVHTPGIGNLLALAESRRLTNVRAIDGDAVEVLDHMIGPQSLSGARIYFPDPWSKARHRKRRLVQPAFVDLLVSRLRPSAYIHCATDDPGYAQQMLDVFAANHDLTNPFDGLAPRPRDRPVTKYEARAERRGHEVADVWITVGSAHDLDS